MSRNVVLVCGGRDFRDYAGVSRVLDDLHAAKPFTGMVHGGASGTDSLADRWAKARNITHYPFPADWKVYGNGAGPIRNEQMLRIAKPNLIVAFPGGKGTADMVRRGKKVGVRIIEIPLDAMSEDKP